MINNHLHIVLLIFSIWLPVGFFVTYSIALSNDHIDADFPYISATGNYPPESCVFAQILDIGALLLSILAFYRYYHVKGLIEKSEMQRSLLRNLNKASAVVIILSIIGITMVGNFQGITQFLLHTIGAFAAFALLLVYLWIQTFIAHILRTNLFSSKMIFYSRITLCVLVTLNFPIMIVFQFIARSKFKGEDSNHWKLSDGGYYEHAISTTSEWCLCFTMCIIILTFFRDFKKIKTTDHQINERNVDIEIKL